jgi:hypothetical protein
LPDADFHRFVTRRIWAKNKDLLMKEYRKMTIRLPNTSRKGQSGRNGSHYRRNPEELRPAPPAGAVYCGDRNQLTETLYKSAVALALYQAMKAHGQDVGNRRVMYRVMEDESISMNRLPARTHATDRKVNRKLSG